MTRLATVNTEGLLELVLAAPLAVVAVALTYGLALRGTAKASEAGRAGENGAAFAWAALAVLAGLAFAAAVVFGIAVIVTKD
jgi:hypothetical protein